MKRIFVLAIIFSATNIFGQTPANDSNRLTIALTHSLNVDSTIKVVYANKINNTKNLAYFLNGKLLVGQQLLTTLDPNNIESINVVNGNIQIDNINYNGKIYIKTKSSYNPRLITLNTLKDKYTNLKNKSAVFMIDGNIVNADYDKYVVDENYILQIVVDDIRNAKENIDLGLIKLLTKSADNIKKSKEIKIRGNKVAMKQYNLPPIFALAIAAENSLNAQP